MKHVKYVQEYMPIYIKKLLSESHTDDTEQLVKMKILFKLNLN